jgi:hypothetical protein
LIPVSQALIYKGTGSTSTIAPDLV